MEVKGFEPLSKQVAHKRHATIIYLKELLFERDQPGMTGRESKSYEKPSYHRSISSSNSPVKFFSGLSFTTHTAKAAAPINNAKAVQNPMNK